jgi:hypothetical protein
VIFTTGIQTVILVLTSPQVLTLWYPSLPRTVTPPLTALHFTALFFSPFCELDYYNPCARLL